MLRLQKSWRKAEVDDVFMLRGKTLNIIHISNFFSAFRSFGDRVKGGVS
jgi:hypothetical protein